MNTSFWLVYISKTCISLGENSQNIRDFQTSFEMWSEEAGSCTKRSPNMIIYIHWHPIYLNQSLKSSRLIFGDALGRPENVPPCKLWGPVFIFVEPRNRILKFLSHLGTGSMLLFDFRVFLMNLSVRTWNRWYAHWHNICLEIYALVSLHHIARNTALSRRRVFKKIISRLPAIRSTVYLPKLNRHVWIAYIYIFFKNEIFLSGSSNHRVPKSVKNEKWLEN